MRTIFDSGDGEKGGRVVERPRGKLWEEEGEPAELWRNSCTGRPGVVAPPSSLPFPLVCLLGMCYTN